MNGVNPITMGVNSFLKNPLKPTHIKGYSVFFMQDSILHKNNHIFTQKITL